MTYLSDMSRCAPQSALSNTAKPNHWRLINYESDEVSGTMLAASPLTDAPDVTCPVDAGGWHDIYVGYWHPPIESRVAIKVRLKSDPYFTPIADDEDDELISSTLREAFWKSADLTGEDIVIGQQKKGIAFNGFIAYLRLEPLSDERVQEIRAERADTTTRIVTPTNDGGALLNGKMTTEADICEQIEIYRHSDIGRLDWAVCYGDMTNYSSEVGWNYYEDWHDDPPRVSDKLLSESVKSLIDKGLAPHKVAMKHAHSIGLQFHVMIRAGIGTFAPPMESTGGLFAERPDLRIIDRDGTPLPKLSYAYPEVRQRMLDIIREVADDEVDGINICWMRGVPCVGYEVPVAEEFSKKYGMDIRNVPDNDERLCHLRASYLTEFMRQVRIIADDVTQRRGRPMTVTAMAGGTLDSALQRSMDIRTWVEEKLVDEMVAVEVATQYLHANGVKRILYVGPEGPERYRDAVIKQKETGADGLMVWDMNSVQELTSHWPMLRQLGHSDRIIDTPEDLNQVRRILLKTVGGVDVEHTAPWGGVHGRALVMFTNG
tara:strand:+ start:611 stop:2245 length:1635 start_codon:yes stop_codon:yes gene_type:complete